jgi:hypothetical protein
MSAALPLKEHYALQVEVFAWPPYGFSQKHQG